ncbi:tetracenomycin C synthesis protein [Calothrix parasitica NIES-267]|uniref:Tetracenomycin C synthesis protein n=1 Tax=Calothrix parasitica NIES-267 TaxID=1973488 RepID=A0A1Z4LKB8_9CYAN|nr:tetracenomycin C synthesis protein [Calothrix parasitica NIES-267]
MAIQKESTEKLQGVPETLMITLYGRYTEQSYPDCILKDEKAVEITKKIDYNFSKYALGWSSQLATVIRAKTIDDLLIKFLATNSQATVINLGGGLCTRFFRIDNGEINWYEVDFPEVIELKEKLLKQSNRYHLIASSILETTWIEQINPDVNQPLFLIMEGVSMYLSEEENKALFTQIQTMLAPKFAPITMVFDVLSKQAAAKTKRHDTVSKTSAKFKWGIDNSQELETWDLGITLKDEIYYLPEFANYPQRMKPFWLKYISFILMPIFRKNAHILQVEINLGSRK